MNRPNPPIIDIGLPLDTEYADDVDFNDEDEENLKALMPIATEVLKDRNFFVNEDKTDFTHVYLAEKGAKDDGGNPIAARWWVMEKEHYAWFHAMQQGGHF